MAERGRKVIGILGGMGPEATADLFAKIIRVTPAKVDQDHFRVLIFSDPLIPDRTAAILGRGESPLPALLAGARRLAEAGADLLAIPCVTAHHFHAELQTGVPIPILHIVREARRALDQRRPGARRIGLLATSGTLGARLFQREFEPAGIEILVPEAAVQEAAVMPALYAVKAGDRSAGPRAAIHEAAEGLRARGAEAIVAGCTEVPLLVQDGELPIPVVDATLALARAAVREAGGEPRG
jgi:aspartate racemase